ncbi:stage II sporulation protein M [bacterium]|nr:stage II sporulation protein M [bacterium]
MIIDLERFVVQERPHWTRLEQMLSKFEQGRVRNPSLDDLKEFHYLYERTAAGLARIATFSSERELREYLEHLVSRAYTEIHSTREKPHRLSPIDWFFKTLPQTFRRQIRAFWLAVAVLVAGAIFGGVLVSIDPDAKEIMLPFSHLLGDPKERVAKEEAGGTTDRLSGAKSSFAASLMQNNIRVSILAMALGMTFGTGTLIVLFYNGIILGAVVVDYVAAGETVFLLGWLLPHGAVEIPAILVGAQSGLVLARALIGRGDRDPMGVRMRKVSNDLMTLMFGVALMLIWAGLIEAFFSQYHAPVLPYSVKIAFGTVELALLIFFLSRSGRKEKSNVEKSFSNAE